MTTLNCTCSSDTLKAEVKYRFCKCIFEFWRNRAHTCMEILYFYPFSC